jgi:ATPase subunit of ABC transporter with duplicated ATPase domains
MVDNGSRSCHRCHAIAYQRRHKLSRSLDTGVTAVYGHVTKRRLAGASPLQRRSATVTVATATPILEARGLSRSFGAVLDEADFDVYAGEVVALIGDNGAGSRRW